MKKSNFVSFFFVEKTKNKIWQKWKKLRNFVKLSKWSFMKLLEIISKIQKSWNFPTILVPLVPGRHLSPNTKHTQYISESPHNPRNNPSPTRFGKRGATLHHSTHKLYIYNIYPNCANYRDVQLSWRFYTLNDFFFFGGGYQKSEFQIWRKLPIIVTVKWFLEGWRVQIIVTFLFEILIW